MFTHTYSHFGCPGDKFIVRDDMRIKIIIDPPYHYFDEELMKDRGNYDKLLLIQGMEPKEVNYISNEIIKNKIFFDKILTSFDEVLNSCENSEKFLYASSWILTDINKHPISLNKDYCNIFNITQKKFQVSHVMSHKNFLPGHNLRHQTKNMIQSIKNVDLYFPDFINTSEKYKLFENSMFHISIENTQNHNYISEKIVDCFMSYTVPIYWGCPNISDYFDVDGIIFFQSSEELKYILENISPDDYFKRIKNIENNFRTAYNEYAFWYDRVNKIIEKL